MADRHRLCRIQPAQAGFPKQEWLDLGRTMQTLWMRPERAVRSTAAFLNQGFHVRVIRNRPGTSLLGNGASQGTKPGHGLAYSPQTSSVCRNDARDWLAVPSDYNLLALRDTFEELAESGLRFKSGYARTHGPTSDDRLASDENSTGRGLGHVSNWCSPTFRAAPFGELLEARLADFPGGIGARECVRASQHCLRGGI